MLQRASPAGACRSCQTLGASVPADEGFCSPEQFLAELRNSPAGRGATARAEVARLAAGSPGKAISIARSIEHPWYRCQALASVVEANPSHPSANQLLAESLASAYNQHEPNRVASVAFWPLRILVKSDLNEAIAHTIKLLGIIAQEPHGLRRLDGLSSILAAVVDAKQLRDAVLPRFLEASKVSHGWRTERIIDGAIHALAPHDRESAASLLASRPVTRQTRRSRALLSLSLIHI